jgi:thioredoxin reductase (NADPH)
VLTGTQAGAQGLLETSVPGVYAAGDVRSGSTERCASAVGEGATVVASSTPVSTERWANRAR